MLRLMMVLNPMSIVAFLTTACCSLKISRLDVVTIGHLNYFK